MTLLPVETFRRILGYHPFHWWGLADSAFTPKSQCNDIVTKYSWQTSDAMGREDVIRAIETAEDKLREYMRYAPALHFVEELLQFPQYHQTGMRALSNAAVDTRWLTVKLREGKTHSIGKETLTLIGSITLTYSDADGDGVNDTFTGTTAATTTETDIDNIDVYFASADRLDGEAAGETWEIAPIKKTINGNGTVTILGRSWMLVDPIRYSGLSATPSNPLDPTVAANFVTTLEVYRHFANPSGITVDDSQAVLIWETAAYPNFAGCCQGSVTFTGGSTDPASIYQAIARAGIRNAEIGEVNPASASFDSTTGFWAAVTWGLCVPPDRVRVRYRAGVAHQANGEMSQQFQTIVARLAAAELITRPTACDAANRELYRWQFDLSRAGGNNDEQYQISGGDLNNPFGTRAGQVFAWKAVQKQAHVNGFAM